MHLRTLCLLFILLPFLCVAQEEKEYIENIPITDGPLEVRMGFNLSNITDVNEKDETIDIEGVIVLMWKDERLAYDPASVGYTEDYQLGDYSMTARKIYQGGFAVQELYNGWRPHVIIQNGIADRTMTAVALGVWPDGMVLYGEAFHASVETPMDLRLFPFDKQELNIHIQPLLYKNNLLVIVPDENLSNTWEHQTGIAQWEDQGFSFTERTIEIKTISGVSQPKSEFIATINIKRLPQHFLLSTILPLVVLVCLSWIVFWMDDESMTDRINISFIGILSVVAYYFVIQDSIPNISYFTLIDCFIIVTFLTLAASVIVSIVVDKLNRSEKVSTGDKIDMISRWAFPLFYFSTTFIITIIFFMAT